MMRNTVCRYILWSLIIVGVVSCGRSYDLDQVEFADLAHVACRYHAGVIDLRDASDEIMQHSVEFDALSEVLALDGEKEDNISSWLNSPAVSCFSADVDTLSLSDTELTRMLSYIVTMSNKSGISLPARRFAATIWGMPKSVIFCDSTMLFALNHYLGSDHPAYSSLDSYRRRMKDSKNLPYDIVEAMIATGYPFVGDEEATVVGRLMYEGALIEAKLQFVENSNLADALGYTKEELEYLEDHEAEIWNGLAMNKLLFDHSETSMLRLVSPSPKTTVISPDTPGRAGRFIGYKIIKSYMEKHSDATLDDILSSDFYKRPNPLVDTGYNPL